MNIFLFLLRNISFFLFFTLYLCSPSYSQNVQVVLYRALSPVHFTIHRNAMKKIIEEGGKYYLQEEIRINGKYYNLIARNGDFVFIGYGRLNTALYNNVSFKTKISINDLNFNGTTFSTINYEYPNEASHSVYADYVLSVWYKGKKEGSCAVNFYDKSKSSKCSFSLSLKEIDPELYNKIQLVKKNNRKKYNSIKNLNDEAVAKIKEYNDILKRLEGKNLHEISESDLNELASLVEYLDSLKKDETEVRSSIEAEIKNLKNKLSETESEVDKILKDDGIDPTNIEEDIIADSIPFEDIEVPELEDIDDFDEENNIYKQSADELISELQNMYDSGDRISFIARVKSWLVKSQYFDEISLLRSRFSPKERQAYLDSIQRVQHFLDKYIDKDLWFKNNPVPVEIRNVVQNQIVKYNKKSGDELLDSLRAWEGQGLTLKQQKVLLTIKALGLAFEASGTHIVNGYNKLVNVLDGAVVAVKEVTKCIAKVGVSGDYADWYEITVGEDYCTGEKLTITGRAISAAGLISGSSKVWRTLAGWSGLDVVAKKVVEASGDIVDSARKLGMSKASDVSAFGSAIADVSESRLAKIVSESARIKPGPQVQSIDSGVIKFSQSSVNGAGELTSILRANGWVFDPIDVVKMFDGTLISVDNTRVLAASRVGTEVKAIVRSLDEVLSPERAITLTTAAGAPKNWGEAVRLRIGKQKKAYREKYPNGSYVTQSLN